MRERLHFVEAWDVEGIQKALDKGYIPITPLSSDEPIKGFIIP